MFNLFKNRDDAFRQVRLITIGSIAASVLITLLSVYFCLWYADGAQHRIYILANGKALEALAASPKENLPVEARDHIRRFHELFFSLEPDQKAITANMDKALCLADASAKALYDNIRESGYYNGIISGNISQIATVDSIRVDMNTYPWHFWCYSTEKIIRATTIATRSLVTEGGLRNTARSDDNPHGFLIEKLLVLDNRDIHVENRPL